MKPQRKGGQGKRRGRATPRKSAWKRLPPTQAGWYWYRSERETVVLHLFDPWGTGMLKAWDFANGRMQLCTISDYPGEWYGPILPPE